MIIDSHIHLYPPSVYQNPQSWAEKRGEPYWLSCVQPAKGKSLQGWKTVPELLHDMDAASIDKAVLLAWYWENHDTCKESLSWQIEWIRNHPDRLIGFAPFNACGGQNALDLLKLAFDVGFKGIGEQNPPAQGYSYDDPILAEAIELSAAYGANVVNLHVTDPTTHDYPGKIETPYESLLQLAREHPNTNFIFSHLGGCEPMRIQTKNPDNIYFDTAACPLLYKKPVYRDFCDTVGADKVLFGTDYPLRVFPKDENAPDFKAPLEQLRNSKLSDTDLLKIISGNAVNLFKLS
ncbi:Amidohydrolase family [Verrucomicrobiia bacterium DG1235]|nr:Amidohydrolase family [Verrucomicrobiae bacterium DG1235]